MAEKINSAPLPTENDIKKAQFEADNSLLLSYLSNPEDLARFDATPEQKRNPNTALAGVKAGSKQVIGDFQTFGSIVDYLQGDNKAAEINLLQAQQLENQANEIRESYSNFDTAFDSPSDFFEYAVFQGGQVTPQLLTFVGGGYASAATYGLGKVALKTGTKKWVKSKLDNIVAKQAGGVALSADEAAILAHSHAGLNSIIKKGLLEEGSEEAIERAATNYAAGKVSAGNVLKGTDKWGSRAFWAGGLATGEVIGASQSLQEYQDMGVSLGKKEAALALAYGFPQAALDTISNKIFFKDFFVNALKDAGKATGKQGKKRALEAAGDILKAAGISAGINAGVEGATEAGQEAILLGQRYTDFLNKGEYADPDYPKQMAKLRLAESALVGGLLGASRGAAGGVISEAYNLMQEAKPNADDIQARSQELQEQGLPLEERKFDVEGQMDSMFDPDDSRDIVFLPNLTLKDLQTAEVAKKVIDLKKYSGRYGGQEIDSNSRNPGVVFHNIENPNSIGLAEAISKSSLSDEVLAKALGFSGTQSLSDKYVVVARDAKGRNISTESVSLEGLEAAAQKAKQNYPNATVEKFLKEDFAQEQSAKVRAAGEDAYDGDFGDDEALTESEQSQIGVDGDFTGAEEQFTDTTLTETIPTSSADFGSDVGVNKFGDAETRPVDLESLYVATDGSNTVELAQQGQDTFLIDDYSKNTFGSARSKTLQRANTQQASAKEGRWSLISDVAPEFQKDRTPNPQLVERFLKVAEQVSPELAAKLRNEMSPKNEIQKSLINTFIRAVQSDPSSDYDITSTETDADGNKVYRIIKTREDDSRRNLRNIINIASNVANTLERPEVNNQPLARAFRVGVLMDAEPTIPVRQNLTKKQKKDNKGEPMYETPITNIDTSLQNKNKTFLQGKGDFPYKFVNIKSLLQNMAEQEGMSYDINSTSRDNYSLTVAIGELALAGFSLEYKFPKTKQYVPLTSMSSSQQLGKVEIPEFVSTSSTGRAVVSTKKVKNLAPYTRGKGVNDLISKTEKVNEMAEAFTEAGGELPVDKATELDQINDLVKFKNNKGSKEAVVALLGGNQSLKYQIQRVEELREFILDAAYRDQIEIGDADSRSFGVVEGFAETQRQSASTTTEVVSEDIEFKESSIRSEFGKDYIINDLAADIQDKTPYRAIPKTYVPTAGKTTISEAASTMFDQYSDTKNVLKSVNTYLRQTFKNMRNIEVIGIGERYKAKGSEKTVISNKEGDTFGKRYSREHLIAKVQNQMRRDGETAKFVSFNDVDIILVNTDINSKERAGEVFTDVIHEFGHSIIEDNMSTLFKQSFGKTKFIVEAIEKDFSKAQKELQGKGSSKYDGVAGREEYIADRVASMTLADVANNPKSAADVHFKRLFTQLKQFIKRALAAYSGRYKSRDIDPDVRKALSKFVTTDRPLNLQNEYKIRSAVDEAFKNGPKALSIKAARKVKQIALDLWRTDLKTLSGSDQFSYWSLGYLLNTAGGYLRQKSDELGKAFYGLTQSEEAFGYKRTYILEQNQQLSMLLDLVPKDKKGMPLIDEFERISAIAESSIPTNQLVDPGAIAFRNFLKDFFTDYIEPKQNIRTKEDKIRFLKDFFPRLWEMSYLRENPDARLTLADLLLQANSNANSPIDMGVGQTPLDSTDINNWVTFVDKWLGTDQDNDGVDVTSAAENLSIGMSKSRSAYFKNITTDMVREADSEMLTPASNAVRRYIQDTVKRLEYDNAVTTTFTQADYDTLKAQQPNNSKPLVSKDRIGGTIYGWQATETMLSRIENGADREGARRSVEAMLGKHGQGMSPLMRNINSWGLLLNMFAYLSMAALASAPDLAGPSLRSKGKGGITKNAQTVVEEVKYYFKNKEAAQKFARDVGVVSYDSILDVYIDASEMGFMNQKTKKLAAWFFKVNLLDAYTRFTRTFAAGMGEQYIFRMAEDADNETNIRHMKELGLDRETIDYWHNTYKNDPSRGKRDYSTPEGKKVKIAIGQFVEESILRPSGAERPTWASNPYFALVFQLKSFFYAYGKNIIGGTGREIYNRYNESGISGAAVPLYIAAMTLLPLTAMGLELRELLKFLANGGDSSQFKTNNMDWGEYLFELTDRAGVYGPLSILGSVSQSNRYGDNPIGPLLGPSAERLEDYIINKQLINNKEDVFWGALPIASGLDLDYFPN